MKTFFISYGIKAVKYRVNDILIMNLNNFLHNYTDVNYLKQPVDCQNQVF